MCVAANFFCYNPPVYVSSNCKTNGCPASICNTGKISKSRQTHQKPAAHVRSLCTHGCYKRTKLSSSKIEIRAVIIVPGTQITYKEHCTQVDDNGCHYTNMCCCHCFSPFLSVMEKRINSPFESFISFFHTGYLHIYRFYYINLRK